MSLLPLQMLINKDCELRCGIPSVWHVYGPQLEADKIAFRDEFKGLKQRFQGECLVAGDFGMVPNQCLRPTTGG
jgi:hypothetical protein